MTLVACAVGCCVFAAALLLRPRRASLRERLQPHVGSAAVASPRDGLRLPAASFEAGRIARFLRGELERAGSSRSPAWLGGATGLAAAIAVAAAALSSGSAALAIAVGLAGALVPHALVRLRARRRVRAFDEQLPDLLDALAAALRVGHGLEQALGSVGEASDEPARAEIARALAEMRLGRRPADALAGVGERLDCDDLSFLTAAVEIHQQVGGTLADIVAVVAETVRERQQFRRKVRALTASGRASAVALVLLPVAAGGVLSAVSPGYMHPLWGTATGRLLGIAALGMVCIGGAILRRMVAVRA